MKTITANPTPTSEKNMTVQFQLNPALCTLDQFQSCFPPPYNTWTQAQVLRWCRDNSFASYAKYCGERSTPIWVKSQVVAWFIHLFGQSHPDAVKSLMTLPGFQLAKADSKTPTPEKRKTGPRGKKGICCA